MKNIEINGTSVPLKFGYGLLRALGDAWGCAGIQGVVLRFEKAIAPCLALFDAWQKAGENALEKPQEGELPFETIDVFADVLHFAALRAGTVINSEDCADYILQNIHVTGMLTAEFLASMPVVKDLPQGKPIPPAAAATEP